MSFLELLQGIGDRLGILEAAPQAANQPMTRIQTRSVTLAQLAGEIRSEEVHALADLPSELTVPFDRIFATAGIAPPSHGWTVDRLRELLVSDRFKDKQREEVQQAVLSTLKSQKISVEDVVKDAMARDQALDSFEAFARQKIQDRMAMRERRVAEIESQVKDLQAEISELSEKSKVDEEKWSEWQKQKRAQERDLAWTISFVVDHPVITTDE